MTSFGLFAFCTTLKKLNTLMANLLLTLEYLRMRTSNGLGFYDTPRVLHSVLHIAGGCCSGVVVKRGSIVVKTVLGSCISNSTHM